MPDKNKPSNLINSADKKGLTGVISIVVIIAVVLVVIVIIWAVISNLVYNYSEEAELRSRFFSEKFELSYVKYEDNQAEFRLKKTDGKFLSESQQGAIPFLEGDIVFVVDVSKKMLACYGVNSECCDLLGGSFSGEDCYGINESKKDICISETCNGNLVDKLSLVKNANNQLVDEILTPENSENIRIGIIAFNNKVVYESSINLTNNTVDLKDKIDSWDSSEDSCICCGINEAAEKLKSSPSDKTKIILVQIGDKSDIECDLQGTPTPIGDAIGSACDANSSLDKLKIYSIGIQLTPGETIAEATLEGIANCGGEGYYNIEDSSELAIIYTLIAEDIRNTLTKEPKQSTLINYLKIVFYSDSDSYIENIYDPPGLLQTKVYSVDLVEKLNGNLKKIEVYPVVVTKSGKEIIGPVFAKWEKK